MIELDQLAIVQFSPSPAWKLKNNRLFDIDPSLADTVAPSRRGLTVWHICFSENILLAVHNETKIVLNVGWLGGFKVGRFVAYLVKPVPSSVDDDVDYDFDTGLIETYETRNLVDIKHYIQTVLESDPRGRIAQHEERTKPA